MANFTSKSLIQGNQLMLFNTSGHSYAYATSHNLSVQGETQDISSKDHGIWGASAVSRYSWSISSDNLATYCYHRVLVLQERCYPSSSATASREALDSARGFLFSKIRIVPAPLYIYFSRNLPVRLLQS